jgi:hypothetical protein
LRNTPADTTGLPSSVNPSAPAAQSLGDRRQEANRHARLAAGAIDQRAEDRGVVDDRIGVRHRDHRAEAAGGGGRRARVEVLLVLLAGRAEVHVGIDERRKRVLAGGVEQLTVLGRAQRPGRAELGDPAVADQDVARLIEVGARVDHVGPPHQQLRCGTLAVMEPRFHQATAARIGDPTSSSYSTAILTATPAFTCSPISA